MNTLEKNEIQTDEAGKNANNDNNATVEFDIIKFTLKTLFLVVVIGVLLFSAFFSVFPYQGIKFFTNLDLKKRALDSADTYIDRNLSDYPQGYFPEPDSKFADALVSGISNSVFLMNDSITKQNYAGDNTKYFAQYVSKHSAVYLKYNQIDSLQERSKMIDNYNKRYSTAEQHPTLYSYSDYVRLSGVRANYALGKKNDIMGQIGATTSTWDADGWKIPSDSYSYNEAFLVFAQLNEYLRMELTKINFYQVPIDSQGYAKYQDVEAKKIRIDDKSTFSYFIDSNGQFTNFYDKVFKRFGDFLLELKKHASIENSTELLKYTYYLKILNEFNLNMRYMGLTLAVNSNFYDHTFVENLKAIDRNWLNKAWVDGVLTYEKDGSVNKAWSGEMSYWYLAGMRTSYILLFNQGK